MSMTRFPLDIARPRGLDLDWPPFWIHVQVHPDYDGPHGLVRGLSKQLHCTKKEIRKRGELDACFTGKHLERDGQHKYYLGFLRLRADRLDAETIMHESVHIAAIAARAFYGTPALRLSRWVGEQEELLAWLTPCIAADLIARLNTDCGLGTP